jgi:hypothetical protein
VIRSQSRRSPAPAILCALLSAPVVADIYRACLEACVPDGLYAEFGVYHGRSLESIRAILDAEIPLYGFDSFEGLPEAWNGYPAGSFATSVRPELPNTHLVVGRFENTVPEFVQAYPGHVSFLHIDCDLYASTRTVLTAFADRTVPGTVILFDELFGYAGFEQHEFRALSEFIAETGLGFEVIGRWATYRAAVRIA